MSDLSRCPARQSFAAEDGLFSSRARENARGGRWFNLTVNTIVSSVHVGWGLPTTKQTKLSELGDNFRQPFLVGETSCDL